MSQQEIEKTIAIKRWHSQCPISKEFNYTEQQVNQADKILVDLATLHLSIMKSGVPSKGGRGKIVIGNYQSQTPEKIYPQSYFIDKKIDEVIDEYTAYLAQKLEGLEKFLYKIIGESNWNNLPEGQVKDLATAIRKYLET